MKVKKGDVIQIKLNNKWGGCLAVVDEVRPWGVQCYVKVPLQGLAYYRVQNEEFDVIGPAIHVEE